VLVLPVPLVVPEFVEPPVLALPPAVVLPVPVLDAPEPVVLAPEPDPVLLVEGLPLTGVVFVELELAEPPDVDGAVVVPTVVAGSPFAPPQAASATHMPTSVKRSEVVFISMRAMLQNTGASLRYSLVERECALVRVCPHLVLGCLICKQLIKFQNRVTRFFVK
jgi:hypothetical protein